MVENTVVFVRIFPVSVPKALSVSPPPNAAPRPPLELARCIKIIKIKKILMRINTNVKIVISKLVIVGRLSPVLGKLENDRSKWRTQAEIFSPHFT